MQILEASTKGVCLFGYLLILPKLCTYWISLHRHLLKIGPSQAKKFFSISPWLNEWFGGRYWQKWRWRSLNSDCLKNNFASLNFRRNEPKIFERLWRGARREEERIATKNGMARWDRIWGADIEREFRRSASRYYFDAPRFPTFFSRDIFSPRGAPSSSSSSPRHRPVARNGIDAFDERHIRVLCRRCRDFWSDDVSPT